MKSVTAKQIHMMNNMVKMLEAWMDLNEYRTH